MIDVVSMFLGAALFGGIFHSSKTADSTAYTVFSYADDRVMAVFSSEEKANEYIKEQAASGINVAEDDYAVSKYEIDE